MPESKNRKFSDCPCAGTTLDKLVQPAMLAILAGGPLHGYELTRRIGEIPGFLNTAPDFSGVYRQLKALESRGIVASDWNESGGNRTKRTFTLTEDGDRCLEHWHDTLLRYRDTIDALLRETEKKRSSQ
jgi:DNA-binding PadR family transcriptional regulator